ncbi:MAG: RNA methyltransferase [Bacteroidales bacterium]|nr:RNA methyltransferase [Bacteroidales bacterium]
MSIPVSNNEIKFVKSLEQKKFRDSNGMFVVEGEKMVEEALNSSFEVFRYYRISEVGFTAMSRMTFLASPSPALAVLRKPVDIEIQDLSYFSLPESGLFLALDGIRDPGNLGTILRIADWFGIDAVFASRDTVDIFNPKVVQATMGAIFRVKFHYCDIARLSRFIVLSGGDAYGTFLDGSDIYQKELNTGNKTKSLIVIGNESNGISQEVAATLTERLLIPSYPENDRGSESLNAAVATAITVAEFRRRLNTNHQA